MLFDEWEASGEGESVETTHTTTRVFTGLAFPDRVFDGLTFSISCEEYVVSCVVNHGR